jgi:ribosome biogenesis GTPase A
MQAILTHEQEELLKRARDVLGDLRDTLAETAASQQDRTALAESIRQLDDLFLLVIAGEFNSGKSSFINALLGKQLQPEGVTPTTAQIYLLKYGAEVKQSPATRGFGCRQHRLNCCKKSASWTHRVPMPSCANMRR